MKSFLSFMAVAILSLGFSVAAQAATVTLANGAVITYGGDMSSSNGAEVDLTTVGGDWTRNDASKVFLTDTNVTGQHVIAYAPNGQPTQNPGTYLAVKAGGVATYTLSSPQTAISFDWGTVDDYNYVTIVRNVQDVTGAYETYTITGALLAGIQPHVGSTQFSLTDSAGIVAVIFESRGSNAFELKNVLATPLPAALVLFGAALVGGAVARRRRKAS